MIQVEGIFVEAGVDQPRATAFSCSVPYLFPLLFHIASYLIEPLHLLLNHFVHPLYLIFLTVAQFGLISLTKYIKKKRL